MKTKVKVFKRNSENKPYKKGDYVKFFNGFDSKFEGEIKDIFWDDKLKRYHYSFCNVVLIEKSDFPIGDVTNLKETYLHSHINSKQNINNLKQQR